MNKKIRVIHYINQFFAGMGGEEQASTPPERRVGPVGPGRAFQQVFGAEAEIVATIICGDNYFSSQPDQAVDDLLDLIAGDDADVLLAGPAFDSGRYGMACGKICQVAQSRLGIPAVTGFLPQNPASDVYASYTYVVPTGNTAVSIRDAVPKMAQLALKLARGEKPGPPEEEHYLPRGRRYNVFVEETAAERSLTMLLRVVKGQEYATELAIPSYDSVPPAAPVPNLAVAKLALGTEGGTVPTGNPDRIEAVRATKWRQYAVSDLVGVKSGLFESAHGGYDARYADDDPNRMVPWDAMRALESEGLFGQLHDHFFSTVGCGMPIVTAAEIGDAMAKEMKANDIEGIILTAT